MSALHGKDLARVLGWLDTGTDEGIPKLVTEAWDSWGSHSNDNTGTQRSPHSPSLADLDRMIALTSPNDSEGINILTSWVTMMVEERAPIGETMPNTDTLDVKQTVVALCEWLTARNTWWSEFDWASDMRDELATLRATLRRICGYPRRNLCPKCGATLTAQPGGQWLQCSEGHQYPAKMEQAYRRRPALPTTQICREFGINEARLWQWKRRHKITPARTEGRTHYWLPWDVIMLIHPDLARQFDQRDTPTKAS